MCCRCLNCWGGTWGMGRSSMDRGLLWHSFGRISSRGSGIRPHCRAYTMILQLSRHGEVVPWHGIYHIWGHVSQVSFIYVVCTDQTNCMLNKKCRFILACCRNQSLSFPLWPNNVYKFSIVWMLFVLCLVGFRSFDNSWSVTDFLPSTAWMH